MNHQPRTLVATIGAVLTATATWGGLPVAASTPPSTAPSGSDPPPLFDGDPEVAPGIHLADGFGIPFEIVVPEGWTEFGGFALVGPDQTFVAFWSPTAVPGDSCHWRAAPATPVATVDEFVNALTAQEGTATGTPRDVSFGDYVGQQLTLTPELGTDITACDEGHHEVWTDSGGGYRLFSTPTESGAAFAIDLNGELAVITAGSFGPILPETQRQIIDILDSITFAAPETP
jgi:hypothetical protein